MKDSTVNRFRQARGRLLTAEINHVAEELGRGVRIVDVGGRPDYWDNVDIAAASQIVLYNLEADELDRGSATDKFERQVGDARKLPFEDASVDFVHSNSVIEHVGHWWDMQAMATELQRVGRHGWVQTPAWEFPLEPHYRLPFLHWLAPPARRALLKLSPKYGRMSLAQRRMHVDRINLLSKAEVQVLFPGRRILVERLVLPKSYVAIW